ncbi:hypothetical protein [Streptomyces sp. NPDC006510]|uniref:hypothetical protein n=1 Tax=Streptomyces sp. NPDC006510 TaxID=3155600 RepID=UPI0033AEF490
MITTLPEAVVACLPRGSAEDLARFVTRPESLRRPDEGTGEGTREGPTIRSGDSPAVGGDFVEDEQTAASGDTSAIKWLLDWITPGSRGPA